jgi:regulator of sirC expression with transglutaminase-like and TPR domain
MDDKKIKAMISLLDDPDHEVSGMIKGELISLGNEVVPHLEDAWSTAFDPLMQERIGTIVHKIQFEDLKSDIDNWFRAGGQDLLTGALIISRYQYPDLDEENVRLILNNIKKDIWVEYKENMRPAEQVYIINKVLFDNYGFLGNTTNFHAPQNSFINTVLESKKGSPLMLSIIYAHLAKQLDIPIFGVNLPEHFILAYQDIRGNLIEEYTYPEAGILFYINPFSKGTIFMKSDVDLFLKKLNFKPLPIFYEPCSNSDMMLRLLRNLVISYTKTGQADNVAEIEELIDLFVE